MEMKEGAQKVPGIPFKEEVDLEEVWRECTAVEDEAECRRKLDEQRKKMQKELREVDRSSFVSKEMQECLKVSLQHQLQEVEKRRNDLMPEHQKVQKRTPNIQSVQDKRRNLQEESLAAKEEIRNISEEIEWKEERFTQLADKVDQNRMADAEMEAGLQGLQVGEGRGSNASQAVDCCLETMVEQVSLWERIRCIM